MSNIVESNPNASVEITEDRRRQIHRQAKALFADGLVMGVRLHLNRAAALHNIKTFQTYKIDGFKSWSEFCEAIGINRQYSYKYTGIARALLAYGGVTDPENREITKKDIDFTLRQSSEYFRSLAFNDLYKASEKLDVFSDAMNGVEITKLLPPAENPADEDTTGEGAANRTQLAEWNDYMREVCKSRGWKWNAKEQRCEHLDGTPCSDEELAMITPPKAATRVWENVHLQFTRAATKMEELVMQDYKTYVLYTKSIRNDEVARQVADLRDEMRKRWQHLDLLLENMQHCDEERIREIHKYGVEE